MSAAVLALDYEVISANDGQRALEIPALESDIDMLFADIVMPNGINGYELACLVRAKHPKIKRLLK